MSKQKQENILQFIENYIMEYKIAPSVREICDGTNIRSTSTIHRYLHQLEQEGKIHMGTGKKRAIFISDNMRKSLPVIEQVNPEFTLLDEQNVKSYYDVIYELKQNVPLFGFYLRENYTELGFQENDLLIAEKNSVQQEQKITVYLNQEGQPDITDSEIPEGAEIIGTVVSMIRDF